MKRIKFKHWKTGEILTVEGTLPKAYNNISSDRYVVCIDKEKNIFEDIIKSTVVEMEDIDG